MQVPSFEELEKLLQVDTRAGVKAREGREGAARPGRPGGEKGEEDRWRLAECTAPENRGGPAGSEKEEWAQTSVSKRLSLATGKE